MKKLFNLLVCFTIFFSVITVIRITAYAEYVDKPYAQHPKKVTISVEDGGYCMIGVTSSGETISNIKSKSKNLRVNLIEIDTDKATGGKWYRIELFSKKKGVTKFTYTYTDMAGVQQNKTVKVKATDETPIKYVKIKNKELLQDKPNLIKFSRGKLKVKMNAGYKLRRVEIDRKYIVRESENAYMTDTETITVKNNSTIEIPRQPFEYYRLARNGCAKKSNITASSVLRIVYVDKFSKEVKEIEFTINKPLA